MPRFLTLLAFLAVPVPAIAQTAQAPETMAADEMLPAAGLGIDISGEVSLLTDYRFRGISRSDEDPAVQAAIDLRHGSGLYAGVRGTSLEGGDPMRALDPLLGELGDAQIDLYAGYGAALGNGFELDGGLLYYLFPDGEGATDYVEPYASLSYLIGPVSATAGAHYAPSQRAIGDEDMLYLFARIDAAIPFRPWSFTAQVGHQQWGRYGDYMNWSLGVEHRLSLGGYHGASVGLRYVDTDLPSVAGQDAGLTAALRLRF